MLLLSFKRVWQDNHVHKYIVFVRLPVFRDLCIIGAEKYLGTSMNLKYDDDFFTRLSGNCIKF